MGPKEITQRENDNNIERSVALSLLHCTLAKLLSNLIIIKPPFFIPMGKRKYGEEGDLIKITELVSEPDFTLTPRIKTLHSKEARFVQEHSGTVLSLLNIHSIHFC